MSNSHDTYIVKVSCPARSGIVSAVSSLLSTRQCYITELAQYDDENAGNFFMRAVFRFEEHAKTTIDEVRNALNDVACEFQMDWELHSAERPMRVLLMVSKYEDHDQEDNVGSNAAHYSECSAGAQLTCMCDRVERRL